MSEAVLKAEGLCRDYVNGDIVVHALSDVSFEIAEGEMIVLLGPSGSGKSTLLNIAGGIETATAGQLYYRGQPVDWQSKKALTEYRRAHVGFVFQFYNLLPSLTALENVALAGELSPDPLDPEKLIDEVGLSDRRDHFPAEMSGGQQQRVAIARALCKNPDILLCDEPTGALDSTTSVQVLNLLWNFNKEYRKSVLIVTHNTGIARIADRVFHFRDGRLSRVEQNDHPQNPSEVDWN